MEEKSLSTRCWEYLMTTSAVLKIAEMIFSVLAFGFSLAADWNRYGGFWVEFTSLSGFMTACIWLFINMCRKEPNRLAELMCYVASCTMSVVGGVIACLKAKTYGSKVVLSAVFCFTAFLVFAFDLAIMFRQFDWRILLPPNMVAQPTTTTTTTQPTSKANTAVPYNTGH